MDTIDYIPRLVEAGLDNDRRLIESVSLTVLRKLKKERPDTSAQIAKILAKATKGETTTLRSVRQQPLPVDRETRFSLVDLEEPLEVEDPILDGRSIKELNDFIGERRLLETFYKDGIEPSNSILFTGNPGVGKTYTAHWISYKLGLPLISLNLATSISSYLGRSGQNVKSVFDFARSQPVVLFLDEFDAIAKRRDDEGDLGELKRLVNVLLKEIEACPKSSVILAATNHPALLDRAIWRRFDRCMELQMPGSRERELLIERHLSHKKYQVSDEVRRYMGEHSEGINAADVCKLCEHIKRQIIMKPEERIDFIALSVLYSFARPTTKEARRTACVGLKKDFPDLTLRDIAQTVGVAPSTVSRYLDERE